MVPEAVAFRAHADPRSKKSRVKNVRKIRQLVGPRSVGHYPLKSPFWPGSGGQITRGDRSEGRRMALSVSLMRLGIITARGK